MFRSVTSRKFFITLTLLLLFAVILYGVMTQIWLSDLTRLTEQKTLEQKAVVKILDARNAATQIQQFLTDVAATGEEGGYVDARAYYERGQQALRQVAGLLPESKRQIEALAQTQQLLLKVGEAMAAAYVSKGRDAGNKVMKRPNDGFDPIAARVQEEMTSMVNFIEKKAENSAMQESKKLSALSSSSMIIAVFVTLMVMFYFWMLLAKLLNPLRTMQQRMAEIGGNGGDLTQRLPAQGADEIALAEQAFNQFAEGMQSILKRVIQAMHKLGTSSEQLEVVYKETMVGMNELHSEADQVATATNEMSATVLEVSKNTTEAAEAAGQANSISENGQHVVEEIIQSIRKLADNVKTATSTIEQLQHSTEQIESILDVIRNISEQTNLLALNAAIEAARAGDAGRGFAVVADEVRTLAGRTNDATAQIQAMIEQFQSDTLASVSAMEQGQTQAGITVEQSANARQALEDIHSAVDTIEHMNTQIATAAEEQRMVAEEINRNVSNVAGIAESTIDSAGKTGALSMQVGMLTGQTQTLLQQFNVGEFDLTDDMNILAVWDDLTFSVGVNSIDRQHQRLFDILNQLYACLMQNKGYETERTVIEELMDYTVTHLSDEESQMQQAQYPDYAQHKAIHDRIIGQATDLKRRYDQGEKGMAMELMMFLKDWLVEHIQKVDRKYMPYMKKSGIN